MRFIEEVPTAAVRVPSFNMGFLPRYEGMDRSTFEGVESDVRPIRKHFYRRMGPEGFQKPETSWPRSSRSPTPAGAWSGAGDGPWLLGAQYSLADIIVTPLIDRMADLGMAEIWTDTSARHRLVRADAGTAGLPADVLSGIADVGIPAADARDQGGLR